VTTYDLDVALQLGFLDAAIQNGRVVLEAKLRAKLIDPNGDGRISLGEIHSSPFSELADLSFTSSVSADLPVFASVGGFSTSTTMPPRIVIIVGPTAGDGRLIQLRDPLHRHAAGGRARFWT
jgi:hypothetical protein